MRVNVYSPVATEERAANPPLLTFDPVTLVQVDLTLGLGSIGPHHHKVSSRDGAVQLPPWSYRLATVAGAMEKHSRVKGQRADGNTLPTCIVSGVLNPYF